MTHTWTRPVPTIGDTTSAADRAAEPDGWSMGEAIQNALSAVIHARRDIRRYRPEPVPAHMVDAIIEAAHSGPSVGHSQPWRFIVIDDDALRDAAAVMADREKLRQAELLTPDRRARLLDLQLEGIREAPLGIVVACDRRTPASGVLGRNTFHDTDLWSCACAIENMWLTARAFGLGMGWVTLFQPQELAALLGLPEGVETLGWMCLGWPDERPPSPGLERRAWSKRLPLEQVRLHNRWREGLPEVVDARAAHMPSQTAVIAARDRADVLLTPPGSLGVLDTALDRVTAVGQLSPGPLILVGADHPVAELGVSAFEQRVTRDVMNAAVARESLGATTAAGAGLDTVVIDAGVRGEPIDGAVQFRPAHASVTGQGADESARADGAGATRDGGRSGAAAVPSGATTSYAFASQGNLRDSAALSRTDAESLVAQGRALMASLPEPQLVCVGEVGIANTTPAAILAAALTGLPVDDCVGLGSSSDASMVTAKVEVATAALARVRTTTGAGTLDPVETLAELGGPEFCVIAGLVLGALDGGHVLVLDGLATSVAALAAVRMVPAVQAHLVASHVSRERAHQAVLTELGLEPMLALRLRAGEGVGSVLASQMLRTGLYAREHTGHTSS